MITRKSLAATHIPARGGNRCRTAVSRCHDSGVRREPVRASRPCAWPLSMCRTASTCGTGIPIMRASSRTASYPEAAGAVQGRHHAPRQPDAQQRPRAARRRRRPRALLRRLPDRRAAPEDRPSISRRVSPATRLSRTRSASKTRFPSLEIGLEDARQAGDCDSGYSCAYTNNLAWRSETQPLPPILDPRALFERLFGNGAALTPGSARAPGQVPA